MDVQWYPGHMTKARRMMEENIRLVDLVIELVDARIPLSSRNPDIDALCRGKGRVVLLCKADLADPVRTQAFVEDFQAKGILAVAVDARERRAGEVVRRYVQEACREKIARDRARGIVGRPLRAMVAGIPNVGKSTFINSFAGRASTKTGNRPGVTRGKQWIRLGGGVELLDTPGILWPKFDSQRIGICLALAGAIRDEVLDRRELAVWLLDYLTREYPGVIEEKYLGGAGGAAAGPLSGDPASVDAGTDCFAEAGGAAAGGTGQEPHRDQAPAPLAGYALLLEIARARRLLMKGAEPDADRAAAMLVDDCRNGRIGRISLDRPEDAASMEEERRRFRLEQEREKEEAARRRGSRKPAGGTRPQSQGKMKGSEPGNISGKASGRPEGKSGAAGKNRTCPGRTKRGGNTISGRPGRKNVGRNTGGKRT